MRSVDGTDGLEATFRSLAPMHESGSGRIVWEVYQEGKGLLGEGVVRGEE